MKRPGANTEKTWEATLGDRRVVRPQALHRVLQGGQAGAVLYVLLSGAYPFGGSADGFERLFERISNGEPRLTRRSLG